MSKFVEFKSISGTRRFVNIDKVEEIVDKGHSCLVYFSKDDYFETYKIYDEVVAIIKQESRENE